ncbi:hypothetical protein ACWCOP_09325 [Maricaulaceae bacterium MS644]
MSRAKPPAPGRVHPLAKPFQRLSGPRTGLFITAGLLAFLLISFAVEFALTGGEGWSKYPEVLGGYEILPGLALAAAIFAGWAVRGLLSASAGFYERGDHAGDRAGDQGGDGRDEPRSAARD